MTATELAMVLPLLACGPAPEGAAAAPCDVTIDATIPDDGAADAYYRTAIEASLSEADESAGIALETEAGEPIPGTLDRSEDGTRLVLTPDAPLKWGTAHTVTASLCAGQRTVRWSFETAPAEPPVDTSLEGRTYALNLSDARIVSPPGVGAIASGLVDVDLLLHVEAHTDDGLVFLGAVTEADGQQQDRCLPTIDLPAADFSDDPYFAIGPTTLGASVQDFSLTGVISADGTTIDNGTLDGALDAASLAQGLHDLGMLEAPTEEAACALLAGFGVDCLTCDSGAACVLVEVDHIFAEERAQPVERIETPDCQ